MCEIINVCSIAKLYMGLLLLEHADFTKEENDLFTFEKWFETNINLLVSLDEIQNRMKNERELVLSTIEIGKKFKGKY